MSGMASTGPLAAQHVPGRPRRRRRTSLAGDTVWWPDSIFARTMPDMFKERWRPGAAS